MSHPIPRIEYGRLTPELQRMLKARVERLGYLGEFFQCTGHQPEILASFMTMTDALKKALPDRLTEAGALTVATLLNNNYERHQHERLSQKLGFGKDWISAIEAVKPDEGNLLSEAERALQRLVEKLITGHGGSASAELSALIGEIGVEQAIAVMFLVGRYFTHAIIVNALELAPPVKSIFEQVPTP